MHIQESVEMLRQEDGCENFRKVLGAFCMTACVCIAVYDSILYFVLHIGKGWMWASIFVPSVVFFILVYICIWPWSDTERLFWKTICMYDQCACWRC